ncbi:MAG: metal-dependent hydrolase [Porticoccaceae bacterium]|jgi:inner membrane protein|nr:metal-dependent hydrolase [Porticoccaceae bacterium]
MDPFAHTFAGAALAATGLRRATPLATAALLIGANAPDVDAVLMFSGDYLSVAHRRGWTHGILAVLVLPLLITAALLQWDRHVRRRWQPDRVPIRPWVLLGLAILAVASHPLLDWLNNYGMRFLMPFDGRWFYGDALFIIDPVVWLVLGGVAFLTWSRRPAALAAWGLFWSAASWLMMTDERVPDTARLLWIFALAGLLAVRWLAGTGRLPRWPGETLAALALALTGVYMLANLAANIPARAEVRAALTAQGLGPVTQVMVSPVPANPWRGLVVAATPGGYYTGHWHWLGRPRFVAAPIAIPANMDDPLVIAAARGLHARRFLTWARFPVARVLETGTGYRIEFGDARYDRGPGLGPVVHLDRKGRLLAR